MKGYGVEACRVRAPSSPIAPPHPPPGRERGGYGCMEGEGCYRWVLPVRGAGTVRGAGRVLWVLLVP